MNQIEFVLQSNGVRRNVIFPCSEVEYQSVCRELSLKDNYAFVRAVVKPKEFEFKEDTFVNLDEINYLAKRMDSFDNNETECFFAAIEAEKYSSTRELINLTLNLNCYTLICDVSSLKNVGCNYLVSSSKGKKASCFVDETRGLNFNLYIVNRQRSCLLPKEINIYREILLV